MTYACELVTIDGMSCVSCPEVVAVAAQPAVYATNANTGWNASALSIESRIGDVYTEFTLPLVVGAVVGFVDRRESNDPRHVPHGFYIFQGAGTHKWAVQEGGVMKTTPAARSVSDVFRIERKREGVRHVVRYFVNNVQVYVSTRYQSLPLRVIGLLYTANDGVN